MNVIKLLKKLAHRKASARINVEAQMRHAERAIVLRRSNTATVKRNPLTRLQSKENE
jgi:hypothetical protein